MRRLLRDVAEGRDLGDTTTLADPAVVDEIRDRADDSRPRNDRCPVVHVTAGPSWQCGDLPELAVA